MCLLLAHQAYSAALVQRAHPLHPIPNNLQFSIKKVKVCYSINGDVIGAPILTVKQMDFFLIVVDLGL